jgi:hypothetical protein
MTDEERYRLDDELKAECREAAADLSRSYQEARKTGEYLQSVGRVLVENPELIVVGKVGRTDEAKGWFPVTQELPTLETIRKLADDIVRLSDIVRQLRQDLRDRDLGE